jgi:hypothetical protein
VLSLLALVILSFFVPFFRILLALEAILYFSIMILAGLRAAIQQRKASLIVGLPLAIPAMHLSWGSGFLWSLLTSGNQSHG